MQPGITGQPSLCEVTGIFIVSFNGTTHLFASPQPESALHRDESDSIADARHFCTFIFQAPRRK